MSVRALVLLASVGACLPGLGCSSNGSARDAAVPCTPGTRQCIDDRVALVCPTDGSGYVSVACRDTEVCTSGACTSTGPNPTCAGGARECLDDRTARVCVADGSGWLAEPCAANEICDQGRCVLNRDAGVNGLLCLPGARQCLDTRVALVCAPDGLEWFTVTCQAGETCVAGACGVATGAACTPYAGQCVNGAAAVCKADGSGYTVTDCPGASVCTGAGLCQGVACVVGTRCSAGGNVRTCADGTGVIETPCPTGQACVDPDPVHGAAACKTNQCTAGQRVCGNRLDTAADQTKYLSECLATPDGYRWFATRCDGYLTCSTPKGVVCSSDCVPGQTQCGTVLGGAAVLTCAVDGTWGAALPCGLQVCGTDAQTGVSRCADSGCETGQKGVCTTPGMVRYCTNGTLGPEQALACAAGVCDKGECKPQCVDGSTKCLTLPTGEVGVITCASGRWPTTLGELCSSPYTGASRACVTVTATKAVCADPECQSGQHGLCTSDGKLRQCVDGKLADAAAAVACPTGQVCTGTACAAATCVAGETSCAGAPFFNAYRTCQGGLFTSAVTFCPTSGDAGVGLQLCIDSRDANNLRQALCGVECAPNARKCQAVTEDGGAVVSKLRVCDAAGKWGPATACAYGQCAGNEPVAGCHADCLPGQVHCGGATVSHPDMHLAVTTGTQSCTAAGTWDTTVTACTAGQYCRTNGAGAAYGCLVCVGSANEVGRVDVRCDTATSLQQCGANNLWPTASVSCNGTCTPASGGSPAYCPTTPGGTCLACAMTNCAAYRTACLADAVCVTNLENCLAVNNCWNSPTFYTCLHNCFYFADTTTSNYHSCLTHTPPPTGCAGGGMCNTF